MSQIAIIGAGNVGHLQAAQFSLKGFSVSVYDVRQQPIKAIQEQKGIRIIEGEKEEFAAIRKASNSMQEIVPEVDLIVICVPAFGHRDVAEMMQHMVRKDQTIIFTPGYGSSIEFAKMLGGLRGAPLIGESLNPIGGSRIIGPATAKIRMYRRMSVAAFPAKYTPRLVDRLKPLSPVTALGNCLEIAILAANKIVHPIPTLMNLSCAENNPEFSLYDEGFTTPVLKCMDAVDLEKRRVCRALGFPDPPMDDLYRENHPAGPFYRTRKGRSSFPGKILDRFIYEDVPYGLVPLASIGRWIGTPTPTTEIFIDLASLIYNRNFREEGRTVETLGLPEPDRAKIQRYLMEGYV